MTELSHAEAHERLADLALEPGALRRLGEAGTDPLAGHVQGCEVCRRELEAWRRTAAAIETAKGSGPDRLALADLAAGAPIAAPAALRAVVSAIPARRPATDSGPASAPLVVAPAARAVPATRPHEREPRSRRLARLVLPLVAVLAVAVVGGTMLLDQAARIDGAERQLALLEGFAASVDNVLNDPDSTSLDLRTADGTVAGTLAWSRRDLVVVTTVLEPPPEGRVYRCWIERDGRRAPVGLMWWAGETAFWNGALDEWATISLDAGGTFGVSLEPAEGAPEGNPAVLSADLGS